MGDIDVQKMLEVTSNASLKGTYGYELTVTADNIYNDGEILGADGKDASSLNHKATAGNNVKLTASDSIVNRGKIKAGRGGHDITNNYIQQESINAQGGRGGTIIVEANTITNEGIIGPEQKPAYENGNIISDGGNGGIASNTAIVKHEGDCDTDLTDLANLSSEHKWNYGNATGGEGGKTLVTASIRLENSGTIASGHGGDARTWWCNYHNERGKGGEITALSNGQVMSNGVMKGGNGRILIEPEIMLSGSTLQLEDSKEIAIFGGDNWQLNLQNLSTNAITAAETITLAVGQGGIIDLTANNHSILKAGQLVQIFSDTILLDEGVTLEDLITAPRIETYPAKILYEVVVSTNGNLFGAPGTTVPMEIRILNVGPTSDTYTLTVNDSQGWSLGILPETITVDGLKMVQLNLEVTLPLTLEARNAITITVTSQHDPNVQAISTTTAIVGEANLSVDNAQTVVGSVIDSKNNLLADTPLLGNQTVTTDTNGHWELTQPNVTGNTSPDDTTAADPFSLLPPQTPACYASGLIDWVCNANGQQLTDLTVVPNGMIAYGTLVGTLTNQGWVSNLTLESNSHLSGGIVTGYIDNHGEMADFEFRGAAIVGGTLAGKISNTSQIGGYFRDVQLAANAHLSGGNLQGDIRGNYSAPALLENVTIKSGSSIAGVKLGEGVIVEDNVTCGDHVQAPAGVCQTVPPSESGLQNFPNLGATASTKNGATVPSYATIRGGIAVNGTPLTSPATITLADEVTIQGQIQVDPTQVGQAGEVVVYLEYTSIGAHEPIYIMLNENGKPVEWDNNLAQLAPFQVIPKLAELIDVLMYQGKLLVTGTLKIGLGYRLADGLVVHNLEPIEVNISSR
ncbi:MAG: hypothetical protein HC877_18765 [Thioploca sp.]|nr:hypothetical protein [Thioploca sp.]